MIDGLVFLISWALIIIAAAFIVVGAVGLIRLPDLYCRLHAASLTDTGGTIVLMLALMLQALFVNGSWLVCVKLALILFFTLFTSPTASHALAKTALLSGILPLDEAGKPILLSPESARKLDDHSEDAS